MNEEQEHILASGMDQFKKNTSKSSRDKLFGCELVIPVTSLSHTLPKPHPPMSAPSLSHAPPRQHPP